MTRKRTREKSLQKKLYSLKIVFSLNEDKTSHIHRITEQFELEGTFKDHLVQPPCSEQGHIPLDQVAQSPVQPDRECFQGGGIDHLSGQSVPVPHHPHGKKFLPYI